MVWIILFFRNIYSLPLIWLVFKDKYDGISEMNCNRLQAWHILFAVLDAVLDRRDIYGYNFLTNNKFMVAPKRYSNKPP